MRHTDQLPIGEHHAGALAAVVEHNIDTRFDEFCVKTVGRGLDAFVAVVTQRTDYDFKWRNCIRPDDAFVVVVLFDCGTKQARDANAVAAHFE